MEGRGAFRGNTLFEISRWWILWEFWRSFYLEEKKCLLEAKQILLEWRTVYKITLISYFLFHLYCAYLFSTISWSYLYIRSGYWSPHIGLLFLFMIYACSSSNLLFIHHDCLKIGLILVLCYCTINFERLFDLILLSFGCFYSFSSLLMIHEMRLY